jgi:hypothetical protein
MAINEGSVNTETCPESLAKTLMPAKPSQKNPLHESAAKTSKNGIDTFPPQHSSYPQYPYGYFTNGPLSYLQHHPQPTPMTPAPPTTPGLSSFNHGHHSSSVISDDIESDKLTLYVNWLIRKNPVFTELTQCLEKLQKECVVFDTLSEVSNSIFETWGFKLGIPLLLKSQMTKYEHAKAKGRV